MNLITGATGLVGAHLLLHLLKNDEEVTALYRSENKKNQVKRFFKSYQVEELFEKINWQKGDILDIPSLEEAMHHVDYVYHCAALISFDPSEYETLTKTNIEGTANVVNVALHKGIKKLCYVSSIAALGDPKNPHEMVNEETEWDPAKPHSDYALSKYGAEHEVFRGFQEGLDVVIVNPGVILGSGFWQQGSGVLFDKIAKGLEFYSKGQTGFVSAFDVVKIMKLAMKSNLVNERFIVIAENKSFDEIAFKIADALHLPRPKYEAKPWMTILGYKFDYIFSKLFFRKRQLSRAMAKSMHTKEHFLNEKVLNTFHFSFEKIDDVIIELSKKYKK
jgi:nucleoside-diphosphate-sugar epimerase